MNDYAYNGYGLLTSVSQYGLAFGTTVADKRVDFTYDADGRWDTITRYADQAATDLVATSTYGYDLAGRLTSLAHTKGVTTLAGYTWTYDDAGRLTQQVLDPRRHRRLHVRPHRPVDRRRLRRHAARRELRLRRQRQPHQHGLLDRHLQSPHFRRHVYL